MRILVIGASGTIGKAVVAALQERHEVITAGSKSGDLRVDISNPASIAAMYEEAGSLDAVLSAAGSARFNAFENLSDDDFAFSLANKLMGQVNLVRLGIARLNAGGSFTLTSGILAGQPMPGSGAISLVNAGLEGFARAAALEAPRGIRVNVVSPPWVSETLTAMGRDPAGGKPAAKVAESYARSVEGTDTGTVFAA